MSPLCTRLRPGDAGVVSRDRHSVIDPAAGCTLARIDVVARPDWDQGDDVASNQSVAATGAYVTDHRVILGERRECPKWRRVDWINTEVGDPVLHQRISSPARVAARFIDSASSLAASSLTASATVFFASSRVPFNSFRSSLATSLRISFSRTFS